MRHRYKIVSKYNLHYNLYNIKRITCERCGILIQEDYGGFTEYSFRFQIEFLGIEFKTCEEMIINSILI